MRVSGWVTGAREYRLAAISAIAISLLLVLLLLVPSRFIPEQPRSAHKTEQGKIHRIASGPARNIAVKSKMKLTPAPRTTEKFTVPKTRETLPAKTVPPTAIKRHMQVKNKLKHGYYIQTGAFRDITKAKKLAGSLQHAGWHVHIINKQNNLHAVLAGPLKTRKQAGSAKSKLAKQSGIKGFIIFITPGNKPATSMIQ